MLKGIRNKNKKFISSALGTSDWVTHDELQKLISEKIRKFEYKAFMDAVTRLVEHPYSYVAKDFIFKYRKMIPTSSTLEGIPLPEVDEDGRQFATFKK